MARKQILRSVNALTRRDLVTGSAAGSLLFLGGCSKGLFGREATSSHAGRPAPRRDRSEVPAHAIDFDIEEGFSKLNKVRKKHWLSGFQQDPRLQEAAQNYVNLMGERGLYGHEIGPGTDFKTRIFAVGFDNSAGENIGVGYGSVDEVITGWMESPAHKKNMLRSRYNLAGFAYGYNTSGRNPRYTHFWVLIMGAG